GLKANRDQTEAQRQIAAIEAAAAEGRPMMPRYIEAARADVTLGEMIGAVEAAVGRFDYAAITANVA
ncbi:MAG: methylmalonyl-CoA mutase family protein, partial [Alphaproteobacteria bacterium]|nr:methylmalonyl-CoA mutase family protein [Alphaproteobacteria bacterium]